MPLSTLSRVSGPVLAAGALVSLAGCFQSEQALPFEASEDAVATAQIGPEGGVLSLASGFSLRIPAGALSSSVQIRASRLITRPFSAGEGTVVPGTAFEVSPAGVALNAPARIELRVPGIEVATEDQIRLGVGLESGGGVVLLAGGSYDATSGILSASLRELGSVAALIADDALGVNPGDPPNLVGGTFGGAPVPGGEPNAALETITFESTCSPKDRRCFSSGLLRAWISPSLRQRLGSNLRILTPVVISGMQFGGFDLNGHPTTATGSFRLTGTLRAQVGASVSSYDIDRTVTTGATTEPSQTTVSVVGNELIFTYATDTGVLELNKDIAYEVRPIGTGALLTVRLEDEVTLENADGTTTTGTVILHLRLRS